MQATPLPDFRIEEIWPDRRISIDAAGEAFAEVAMALAGDAGVSCVLPNGDFGPVNLTLVDVPVVDAFRELGRSAGLVATYTSGVVRMSRPGDVVAVPVVIPSGFEDVAAFRSALGVVLGTDSQVQQIGDRVVVRTTAESAERVASLLHQLSHGPDGWALDIRVIQVTRSLREQLGLDWRVSGRMGGSLGGSTGIVEGGLQSAANNGIAAVGALDVLFQAVSEGIDASIVTESTAYLLEGHAVSVQQGDVIPVPQRTVSDQGTVTVTGYTQVNTGFNFTVTGRRVQGGLLLELQPELSNVTGFVEGAPIVSRRSVSSTVVVDSGEWVLLSGLDASEWSRESKGVPGASWLGGSRDVRDEQRSSLILVRAVRVYASGGVVKTPVATAARCELPEGTSIKPTPAECAEVAGTWEDGF